MLPIQAKATAFPGKMENCCDRLVRFKEGMENLMVQLRAGLTKDQFDTAASHDCEVLLLEVTFV
jgi:hypothetical protein